MLVRAEGTLRGLAMSSSPTSRALHRLSTPTLTAWQLQRRPYTPPAARTLDERYPFTGGGPEPPSGPPTPPPRQRSATSEFYRAMVPSMLHCLALGSIVYYALELAYMYLAREKDGLELRAKVERLEDELALARAGPSQVDEGVAAPGKSWWKLW